MSDTTMNTMSIDWNIIRKSATETLTGEESAALQEWLSQSERHRALYRKVTESGLYAPSAEQLTRWRKGFEIQLKARQRRRRRIFLSAATSVAALIAVALLPLWLSQEDDVFKPVDRKITLTTATGETFEWDAVVAGDGYGFDGMQVSKSNASLTLAANGPAAETQSAMTTLHIPNGKDFFLELSDGTKVWLNSGTELTFPLQFTGAEREVMLTGEAYFEVAPDVAKPFNVITSGASVRVLGTSFNVSAYEADRKVEVALLEGRVAFETQGGRYLLAPGQMAALDAAGGVEVTTGDVDAIASWITGVYDFRDMELGELATKLERWYGVGFEFRDDAARILRFSGAISRSRDLQYMLDMISKTTSVEFTAKRGVILIGFKD